MKIKLKSLSLVVFSIYISSCDKGSSPAKTEVPNVTQNGCVKESDLMKPGSTSSIVGGSKVAKTDPDSKKVMMLYTESKNGKSSICTTTAIAPNVLLTAAHCLSDDFHAAIFNTSISCESGFNMQTHMGRGIDAFMHPDYNRLSDSSLKESAGVDIAIVILEKSIPSPYRIMKIANPNDVDLSSGSVQLIGYGTVNYKAGGSAILRKTNLPSKQIKIEKDANVVLIDQSLGHGVCSGDSGGPSFVKIRGQEQILGVNSAVYGATKEEDACKVAAIQSLAFGHIEWIKSELAKRGYNIEL